MDLIVIQSTPTDDSTTQVMRHLRSLGRRCLRLSDDDPVVDVSLDLGAGLGYARWTHRSGLEVDTRQVAAIWHRRGDLTTLLPACAPPGMGALLEEEWRATRAGVFELLRRVRQLGGWDDARRVPHLVQLQRAQALGIQIPPTRVTTSRAGLLDFLEVHGSCVTKRIEALPEYRDERGRWAAGGTHLLGRAEIEALEERLFPTLIQARVESLFELRIFFLAGELFPMALLPTRGAAPVVDVRTADPAALRPVPYALPEGDTRRLQRLMAALDLNTGSIDVLVTPEGEHVFLEVNPAGQFEGVSRACHPGLEQRIAQYLASGLPPTDVRQATRAAAPPSPPGLPPLLRKMALVDPEGEDRDAVLSAPAPLLGTASRLLRPGPKRIAPPPAPPEDPHV